MKVTLVGYTVVSPRNMIEATDNVWVPEVGDDGLLDQATALTEFAGRACYQSWHKPNPATATPEGYAANLIEQRHFSVMEHGSVTFHITEVSRSLTHELVRHRHLSFSQLSQRFVAVDGGPVIPPLFRGSETTEAKLQAAWEAATALYEELVEEWLPMVRSTGVGPHRARKVVREAARAVLPNMTPTKIVVTGNHRAWREFLEKRGSIHADAEIRQLAIAIYEQLNALEPALYQDFALIEDEGEPVLMRLGG